METLEFEENLKNPKQGDIYKLYPDNSNDYIKIIIGKVKKKKLIYYRYGRPYKISITELKYVISSYHQSVVFEPAELKGIK